MTTVFLAKGFSSGIYIERLFNGCSPILCDRLPLTLAWPCYCLYYVVAGFMGVSPLSVLFVDTDEEP